MITPPAIYYDASAAVLRALDAVATRASVNLVVAWEWAEWGGGGGLAATNNPLATTQPMPGSTAWNSAGVQRYPSMAVGAEACARSIRAYPTLLRALRASDASLFFGPVGTADLSIWASGSPSGALGYASRVHQIYLDLPPPPVAYTYGAIRVFPGVAVPAWTVAAVLLAWGGADVEYQAQRAHRSWLAQVETEARRWAYT